MSTLSLTNTGSPISAIELSFELWEKSIKVLEDWLKTKPIKRKGSNPKTVRTYLTMMGFAPKVAMGLGKDIANGINTTESEWYPLVLRRYKDLFVELKLFQNNANAHAVLGCGEITDLKTHQLWLIEQFHHKRIFGKASLHQCNQVRVTSTQYPLSGASQLRF